MEFLELLQSAMKFAPAEYSGIADMVNNAAPYLLLIISAATCFFGLKIHKAWIVFMFFNIGFWLGALAIGMLAPKLNILVSIAVGIVLGIACAFGAARLRKLQVFILNSVMAYILVSAFILRFQDNVLIAVGSALVVALIAGALAVHFLHTVTIITTSLVGAQNIAAAAIALLNIAQDNLTSGIIFIVLGLAGIIVQGLMLKHHEAHRPVKISHYTKPTNM